MLTSPSEKREKTKKQKMKKKATSISSFAPPLTEVCDCLLAIGSTISEIILTVCGSAYFVQLCAVNALFLLGGILV